MASYKHQCHEVDCGRAFDTPGKLNRHSKAHSKPLRCSACERGFALRLDLDRHVKARHRLGHQRYACSVVSCHYSSARKDNIRQHEKKLHGKVAQQEPSGAPHIPAGRSVPQLSDDQYATNPMEFNNGTNDSSWRCTTFLQAATAGNLAIVEAGLNMGIDVNITADDLSTALHCAARAGQTSMVEFLLKKGAHLDARNRNRMSPLQEAILSQNSETVKMLLLHGSQLDNVRVTETCVAQSGSVDILQACMTHDRRDEFKYNVFNAASRLGQPALITALLTIEEKHLRKFDPHHVPLDPVEKFLVGPALSWLRRTNSTQYTPMHHAAAKGHVRVLQLLLDHQFDINIKTCHRLTPLHLAARVGGAEVVAFLLGQRDIEADCKDAYELMPLHYAIEKGNIHAVRLLLENLQSNSDDFEYPQSMVLPFAAGSGHLEVVEFLLSQKNINVQYRDNHNNSSLQLSAIHGHWEIAQALLNKEDENRGLEAQFQSSERDQVEPPEVMMRLLKHQDFQDINVVVERGNLSFPVYGTRLVRCYDHAGLLHIAVTQADCSILRVLLSHEEIDVNLPTRCNGYTPLHLATANGYTQAVELLLQHGKINPNSQFLYEGTCLQLTISHGQADIAKLLIQHDKTDVNLCTSGSTPLEMATEKGFDELVELILARQALDLISSTLPSASTHYLTAEPAVARSHIEEHTECDLDIAPSSFLDEYMDENMDDHSEYMRD